MKTNVRKLTTLAMLAALAYIVMATIKIPFFPAYEFFKYEPKDVIITIGGFIYGPLASLAISLVVSFAEALTVSTTGPVGMMMNVIATVSFACTATYIYKRDRTLKGALKGLIVGCITLTASMVAWNYIVTPGYMKVPRDVVEGMLIPVIIPFNLLKGVLNSTIIVLIYKPVVEALRKMNFIQKAGNDEKRRFNLGLALAAALVLATCVFLVLVIKGII